MCIVRILSANDDQRLELNGLLEPDYYSSQTKSGAPIRIVGSREGK